MNKPLDPKHEAILRRTITVINAIRAALLPLAKDPEFTTADFISGMACVQSSVFRVIRAQAVKKGLDPVLAERAIHAALNLGSALDQAFPDGRLASSEPPPVDLPESGPDWELSGLLAETAIDFIIKGPKGEQ